MPTRQESIDFILDHYENPRRHGALPEADLVLKGGNPGCGDVVTIYLKLDPAERVMDASFEGEGCTISQAAASVMMAKVVGRTLAEIAALGPETVVDEMGREVVSTRLRCASLALNTLKSAEKHFHAGAARSAQDAQLEAF
jgi:nitrogen fixation NifU-like protein